MLQTGWQTGQALGSLLLLAALPLSPVFSSLPQRFFPTSDHFLFTFSAFFLQPSVLLLPSSVLPAEHCRTADCPEGVSHPPLHVHSRFGPWEVPSVRVHGGGKGQVVEWVWVQSLLFMPPSSFWSWASELTSLFSLCLLLHFHCHNANPIGTF